MKINKKYKGVIFILIAGMCFALMAIFVRLAGDVPSVQKSFFRNSIALVCSLILIFKQKIGFKIQKGNLKFFILRASFGTAGLLLYFYSIDHLVVADATMLNKMSPFFAIVCSFIFLKEKLTPVQVISVIVAFVGSMFVVKPTFQNIDIIPAIAGLLGGVSAGVAYTCVRKLGQRGEKGPFIVFFFSAFSTAVTLPYIIMNFSPMTMQQFIILVFAGIFASGGQFAITAAYCYAPAREISVFDYSQVVYTAILGFFLFDQIPDVFSIIGYVLIIGTAVGMFIYNKKNAEGIDEAVDG